MMRMPTVNADAARPTEGRMLEWLLRAFALLILTGAVWKFASAWWAEPSRLTILLLLLTEGYTLVLVLFARRAQVRDASPLAIVATLCATYAFALIEPSGTTHLMPESAGVALLVFSTLWQFSAKLTIGRSFGVLPALRGVVTRGPYRVVRHPIYFGYLINHAGFLLVNFSWRNAAVLGLLYLAQVVRILREEAVLAASSDEYRSYQQRVRWRLLPFVF